jgi:hypothetical protein
LKKNEILKRNVIDWKEYYKMALKNAWILAAAISSLVISVFWDGEVATVGSSEKVVSFLTFASSMELLALLLV